MQSDLFWVRPVDFAPFENLPTELTLLPGTPGIDIAVCGQNHKMIVASCYGDNFFGITSRQMKDGRGQKLIFRSVRKSKSTLVGLL